MAVSTLVSLFKSEKAITEEDGFIKITVTENYKLLWNILKLPNIRVLIIAILTARVSMQLFDINYVPNNFIELSTISENITKLNEEKSPFGNTIFL